MDLGAVGFLLDPPAAEAEARGKDEQFQQDSQLGKRDLKEFNVFSSPYQAVFIGYRQERQHQQDQAARQDDAGQGGVDLDHLIDQERPAGKHNEISHRKINVHTQSDPVDQAQDGKRQGGQ